MLQVDVFFVPVLHMLSNKLHLPPSVAGMTLLALGNGLCVCVCIQKVTVQLLIQVSPITKDTVKYNRFVVF